VNTKAERVHPKPRDPLDRVREISFSRGLEPLELRGLLGQHLPEHALGVLGVEALVIPERREPAVDSRERMRADLQVKVRPLRAHDQRERLVKIEHPRVHRRSSGRA